MAKKQIGRKKKHHHVGAPEAATIVFADNVFWDPSDPYSRSPVVATTIPNNFVVKRSQKNVRWDLDGSGVTNVMFDPGLVGIGFKYTNPLKTITGGGPSHPFILADVKDKTQIMVGRYPYTVLYWGQVAQDPELDVSS